MGGREGVPASCCVEVSMGELPSEEDVESLVPAEEKPLEVSERVSMAAEVRASPAAVKCPKG